MVESGWRLACVFICWLCLAGASAAALWLARPGAEAHAPALLLTGAAVSGLMARMLRD